MFRIEIGTSLTLLLLINEDRGLWMLDELVVVVGGVVTQVTSLKDFDAAVAVDVDLYLLYYFLAALYHPPTDERWCWWRTEL